jgi:hypothetical protein
MVYNILIDARIHQVIAFADDRQCKAYADKCPDKNLFNAITVNRGRAIPDKDGHTNSRWYMDNNTYRSLLVRDVSALISQREQILEREKADYKKVADEAKADQQRAASAERDVHKCVSPSLLANGGGGSP